MSMLIPFTRPTLDEQTIADVAEVLRSGWITSGPKVKAFEAALSEYFGGRRVRAFNSGTATLEVALGMLGIGAGSEVITTPLTWVATANVIVRAGARPVFVDVDPHTRNIDLDAIAAAVTPATRAVIPVDLAGLPVDRDRLHAVAAQHGLRVIEDAAQSMGANWKGRRIGSFGDYVSFSFHANKNMTTAEGGCLVLPADADAALCERMRLQGVARDADGGMDVDLFGGKFNLTDLAAVIGINQLRQVDGFNERRRVLARHYFERLADAAPQRGLQLPPADFTQSNWHMFQVCLPLDRLSITRGDFIRAMSAAGIAVGVHYPALHLFSAYRALGFRPGSFPHAERIGREIVTLPLFPTLTEAEVDRVCSSMIDILDRHRA
ncbi:MAG: DegT/DnrJ/EryC1/StrS aminotransferase family protein [Rhodocyclaceae bacterium]|nr:DegT/DnrJ/EryC1/StrS aminotransferase family protein [Rhodocyclaceae bacterium]MBX3668608.1 DegT/DnrJ/EryC1/StrS aminotransferase family protein [Rhodocyclaceae bacterium]